jgi:hypothetical protein
MDPRNRFQGIDSASLCSPAGRYDNPIPTWFLAPIECLKIRAQVRMRKERNCTYTERQAGRKEDIGTRKCRVTVSGPRERLLALEHCIKWPFREMENISTVEVLYLRGFWHISHRVVDAGQHCCKTAGYRVQEYRPTTLYLYRPQR